MQISCDPPHCKSHHSGDPLIPLSPCGAPKLSKIGPDPELPAKAWRCFMGHCVCRGKKQEITKCSEPNEKRKGFKMQEQGPERRPRKQSIPTRLIIPRVGICCPVQGVCSVPGYPRMRHQGKVPVSSHHPAQPLWDTGIDRPPVKPSSISFQFA